MINSNDESAPPEKPDISEFLDPTQQAELSEIADKVAAQMAARERLTIVIPYLRAAIDDANKQGKASLGILCKRADGGGKVECEFGAEMIDDLSIVLNMPLVNSREDKINAALLKIKSQFGSVEG